MIGQLSSHRADSVIQRRTWTIALPPEYKAKMNGLKFRGRQILDQLKKECCKQLNRPNMECTVQSCDCVSREVFEQGRNAPLGAPSIEENVFIGI